MTWVETTKLDALAEMGRKKWSVQRNFLLDPAKSPKSIFRVDRPSRSSEPTFKADLGGRYDISRAGMHPGEPGKSQGVAWQR
jgi:hypothetical protein